MFHLCVQCLHPDIPNNSSEPFAGKTRNSRCKDNVMYPGSVGLPPESHAPGGCWMTKRVGWGIGYEVTMHMRFIPTICWYSWKRLGNRFCRLWHYLMWVLCVMFFINNILQFYTMWAPFHFLIGYILCQYMVILEGDRLLLWCHCDWAVKANCQYPMIGCRP